MGLTPALPRGVKNTTRSTACVTWSPLHFPLKFSPSLDWSHKKMEFNASKHFEMVIRHNLELLRVFNLHSTGPLIKLFRSCSLPQKVGQLIFIIRAYVGRLIEADRTHHRKAQDEGKKSYLPFRGG